MLPDKREPEKVQVLHFDVARLYEPQLGFHGPGLTTICPLFSGRVVGFTCYPVQPKAEDGYCSSQLPGHKVLPDRREPEKVQVLHFDVTDCMSCNWAFMDRIWLGQN
ncbi:hypothetical protein CLOSTMETH_03325 [[Clostridium] methylpentosum DSM 5476]|uniref:Uncharacterized protein n=1 Tax=[Clostridium] methylpentosum DSM 5476 TaxID=537013 RepID=C0EHC5_9FIRM|nr:hypothetical protein CLOSTMETH_03325 [[Clostridium] methylpentosum DSM 5476]